VLPILGAGASFLLKGFIDQARNHAARVLDLLNQVDPAGDMSIVGIEPPEIYAFKHDYLDLLPQRREEINQRVEKVWFLDEYLLRSKEFEALRVVNMGRLSNAGERFIPKKIMFHPHCHQRAEGTSEDGLPIGVNATIELLRSCNYEVELMDTGCCGMAGTFGYEAEHYEVSMKVGELKLFPLLRQVGASADSEGLEGGSVGVVSSGAACRMQIQQGTGAKAIHPIVLIANLLNEAARYER
jgi:Fe-S oxidoreductase